MLIDAPDIERPQVALIPMGDAAERAALTLIARLRRAGIASDMGYRGNMKKRMQRANASGAIWAVIIGDDELAKGEASVRNLGTGEQQGVPLDQLVDRLAAA
jgi:histidyl-tRNA synthetase